MEIYQALNTQKYFVWNYIVYNTEYVYDRILCTNDQTK